MPDRLCMHRRVIGRRSWSRDAVGLLRHGPGGVLARRPGCQRGLDYRRGFCVLRLRGRRRREAERGLGDHFKKAQIRISRLPRIGGFRCSGIAAREVAVAFIVGGSAGFKIASLDRHDASGLVHRRTAVLGFRGCTARILVTRMLGKPVHECEQALQRQRIVVLRHPPAFSRPRRPPPAALPTVRDLLIRPCRQAPPAAYYSKQNTGHMLECRIYTSL